MISLLQLLNEVDSSPKAIILAGAPVAGKGYVLKGLDLNGLKIMNIDNSFINKLKQAKVSLDLKNLRVLGFTTSRLMSFSTVKSIRTAVDSLNMV